MTSAIRPYKLRILKGIYKKEWGYKEFEVPLLPCPFCHSENVAYNDFLEHMECQDCRCCGPNCFPIPYDVEKTKNLIERSFEAWNRRYEQ